VHFVHVWAFTLSQNEIHIITPFRKSTHKVKYYSFYSATAQGGYENRYSQLNLSPLVNNKISETD
jgi:hypothetical protein